MSIEISGKVIKKLDRQTGQGRNGEWVKQEFILETDEQYPKKVCIAAWGDKAGQAEALNLGDRITVSVNIESREYNERWYTDIKAWRIQPDQPAEMPPMPSEEPPLPDIEPDPAGDLPF